MLVKELTGPVGWGEEPDFLVPSASHINCSSGRWNSDNLSRGLRHGRWGAVGRIALLLVAARRTALHWLDGKSPRPFGLGGSIRVGPHIIGCPKLHCSVNILGLISIIKVYG